MARLGGIGASGPRSLMPTARWPKRLPTLTAEQERIRADFLRYWLQTIPGKYRRFEQFGHRFVASQAPAAAARTLEIGAGLGSHLGYEDLTVQRYVVLEPRPDLARHIVQRYPRATGVIGDAQAHIPCPDGSFDRVIAIHVLEHLPNLPAALAQIRRVLKPDGRLLTVVPCEGGWAYRLGRRLSAKRIFERRYGQPYDWFIRSEHVSGAAEILELLPQYFRVRGRRFWPLRVASLHVNLVVGLSCSVPPP